MRTIANRQFSRLLVNLNRAARGSTDKTDKIDKAEKIDKPDQADKSKETPKKDGASETAEPSVFTRTEPSPRRRCDSKEKLEIGLKLSPRTVVGDKEKTRRRESDGSKENGTENKTETTKGAQEEKDKEEEGATKIGDTKDEDTTKGEDTYTAKENEESKTASEDKKEHVAETPKEANGESQSDPDLANTEAEQPKKENRMTYSTKSAVQRERNIHFSKFCASHCTFDKDTKI